jgi:hypothetical protein
MTKFANTPEGRAAANASMAATGTTMGPRPSGPKAATSIKAPNATQASPRRRMAGDPSRSRPTMPAGAGRSGTKNPSAPPQASSQYSPPGNMSPALRQKLQARNAAGAKGRYSAQVGANSGRSPSMAQKPTAPKSSYQKGDAFKNQPNRAAPTVGGRRMNVGGAASRGYADRAAGYADRAVASAPMPAYMAQGRDEQARIVRNPVDQESRAVNLANKRAQKAYYSQVSAPYRTPGRYGGADQMVRPGVMGGPPSVSAPQAPAKSGSIYGSRAADMASGRGPGRVGRGMRGGGLARKGVGMALAKGGLARRAGGCAKRGVGKGRIL